MMAQSIKETKNNVQVSFPMHPHVLQQPLSSYYRVCMEFTRSLGIVIIADLCFLIHHLLSPNTVSVSVLA